MPRGYRCIVFAVLGVALINAAPSQGNGQDRVNGDGNGQIAKELNRLEAAIKASKPAEKADPGCPKGQDNRSSDLCAQWKAADAASEGTWWTAATFWLGTVGALIGALTLGAAAYAAWYARKAWEAASHSAESFVKVEDASLVLSFPTGTEMTGTQNFYTLRGSITNVGRSTALINALKIQDEEPILMSIILPADTKFAIEDLILVEKIDGEPSALQIEVTYSTALKVNVTLIVHAAVLLYGDRKPWAFVSKTHWRDDNCALCTDN